MADVKGISGRSYCCECAAQHKRYASLPAALQLSAFFSCYSLALSEGDSVALSFQRFHLNMEASALEILQVIKDSPGGALSRMSVKYEIIHHLQMCTGAAFAGRMHVWMEVKSVSSARASSRRQAAERANFPAAGGCIMGSAARLALCSIGHRRLAAINLS
ncbi:hypothetical protein SRHO_G00283570 [Serrasalmus rhombeus]